MLSGLGGLTDVVESLFRLHSRRLAFKVAPVAAGLDLAASMGMAPRGHMFSAMMGAATGQVAATAASMIPYVGIPLSFLADIATRGPVERATQAFVELDGKRRSLNMGGNYRDTQMAYTMRQVASRELSGSLLNARQHLGKEAALMHA